MFQTNVTDDYDTYTCSTKTFLNRKKKFNLFFNLKYSKELIFQVEKQMPCEF
jgi:hypothetical protein